MLLAIDPGNEKSAWILYKDGDVLDKGIWANDELLSCLRYAKVNRFSGVNDLAIEMIASYGMAVGKTVFETCVWIGRFIQAWQGQHRFVYRKDVKMFLCGSMKAKDANIRQAIMDRYGSSKEKAIGTKKNQGPLYGVSKDIWSALAVAITASENYGN